MDFTQSSFLLLPLLQSYVVSNYHVPLGHGPEYILVKLIWWNEVAMHLCRNNFPDITLTVHSPWLAFLHSAIQNLSLTWRYYFSYIGLEIQFWHDPHWSNRYTCRPTDFESWWKRWLWCTLTQMHIQHPRRCLRCYMHSWIRVHYMHNPLACCVNPF